MRSSMEKKKKKKKNPSSQSALSKKSSANSNKSSANSIFYVNVYEEKDPFSRAFSKYSKIERVEVVLYCPDIIL